MNINQETSFEKNTFVRALSLILDASDLHINDSETAKAETNTMNIRRSVLGVVYPRTLEQLQHIMRAANQHGVSLYPVSQGKNIGYGEMTPTSTHQLVVGLKYLNAIREFDERTGEVVVEPGVTQAQLAKFLADRGASYWADVTGASPEASIVGNTLEAGFGHTPIGDHRKHILQMDVMLADGTMLRTAEMPAIGPDLAQLFIQSNFGIVTAIRIPLFPIPETTVTFTISFHTESNFHKGISVLSSLRRDGTISSLLHTGNSTRALMTSSRFPADRNRSEVLSDQDCYEILMKKSPLKLGMWSSVGGLYGYQNEVRSKQRRIKKAFKGIADVKFFTNGRIEFLHKLLNSKLLMKSRKLDFIRSTFASLKSLHGILRGQPSNGPSENIFWRVDTPEKLGLLWFAPVIPATKEDCAALMDISRQVYAWYGFEMPVTLTLIDAKHMTAVFNISYDKTNAQETANAHAAYKSLTEGTTRLGYFPYRCGLLSSPSTIYSREQHLILEKIKSALDPKGIVAPGRYGIGDKLGN